ncbi:hypothetical protein PoMZ_02840 [Pyricularia oryzae]|uniref:Hydrophobin n=1 Tax=Pyricularia oryzae TaxID=318829 RepID=A0A4P7N6A4_PYROR|nr:hypothetical protein PoMZ_02840 [Pyricularia oryzae]
MRSSTIILAPFLLFTGLVAAKDKNIEVQPDFQGPQTGGICCDAGTNSDTDKFCSSKNLNAFCCGPFHSNRKGEKGLPGGCDPFPDFPTGRNVLTFPPGNQQCVSSGGHAGFIGLSPSSFAAARSNV